MKTPYDNVNISQYIMHDKLAENAIASLSLFASIEESIVAAGQRASETPDVRELADVKHVVIGNESYSYAQDCTGDVCILHCESEARSIAVPGDIEGHTVTTIGEHTFSTCYSLEQVALPDTIVVVGKYAFMNTALSEFIAPPVLRSIGENAFYQCAKLEKMVLNDGLRTIGQNAFKDSALVSLSIPASTEFIGQNAFKGTSISFSTSPTLRISPDNAHLLLEDGALYAKDEEDAYTLIQVLDEGKRKFTGFAGTVRVASKAFANLKNLESVTLPEGTLSLGDKVFSGCKTLTNIDLPNTLCSLGRQAFQDTRLRTLRIPAMLSEAGIAAFYTGGSIARRHKPSIETVEIDPRNKSFYLQDGILCQRTDHGVVAQLYIGDAEHLVIPREVTSIGMYAFLNCSTIKSVELHDGIESIDVGGLDTGRSLISIVYNVYGGEERLRERYVINFPPGQAGREAAKLVLSRGTFSLSRAFEAADDAIFATQDVYLRGKAILERLHNPVMLKDSTRAAFERRLRRAVPATVIAFGKCGFSEGIDLLYEQGVICAGNIDGLIEAASDADELAVLSRLMELKRTTFDARMFDFDL